MWLGQLLHKATLSSLISSPCGSGHRAPEHGHHVLDLRRTLGDEVVCVSKMGDPMPVLAWLRGPRSPTTPIKTGNQTPELSRCRSGQTGPPTHRPTLFDPGHKSTPHERRTTHHKVLPSKQSRARACKTFSCLLSRFEIECCGDVVESNRPASPRQAQRSRPSPCPRRLAKRTPCGKPHVRGRLNALRDNCMLSWRMLQHFARRAVNGRHHLQRRNCLHKCLCNTRGPDAY